MRNNFFIILISAFWLKNYAVCYATTTTSTVSNAVQEYLDRVLLLKGLPLLTHVLFGRRTAIPKNSGDKAKFIRINSLAAATTPLTEGTNPSSTSWGKTEITATLAQYGAYVENSDLKDMTEQSVVLNGVIDALGEQMGDTLDQVCRDVINGGTSVLYANSVAGRANVITAVSKADIDRLINQLATGNARKQTEMYKPGHAGLTAIDAAFPVIVHPHLKADIRTACGTSFVEKKDYPAGAPVFDGEFGSYDDLRFIATTNAKIWADSGAAVGASGLRSTGGSNIDVYSILALGKDAFGVVPLADGDNIKTIVKTKEVAGGALEMSATIGWKAAVVYKILNDNFMARLEVGATA